MTSLRLLAAVALPLLTTLPLAAQDESKGPPGAAPAPTSPPAAAPRAAPVVAPPSATENEALEAELALLARAAQQQVTVPPDARSLRELLESLGAQSGIEVEGDWEALGSLRVSPDDPPTLERGQGSLLSVLDAICVSIGTPSTRPRCEAILGRLRLVTTPTAVSLRRTRAYQADQLADDFLNQAVEHIDPEGWIRNGGETQHATRIDGTLLVSAPATIHRRLATLLDELRLTRATAIEFAAEIVQLPTATWRARSNDAGGEPVRARGDLNSVPGVVALSAPTIVAALDSEGSVDGTMAGISMRLAVRPERDPDRGMTVRFELRLDQGGSTAMTQGTIPAPVGGLPALVALEAPGTDQTIVMFLRARPLPRSAASTDR